MTSEEFIEVALGNPANRAVVDEIAWLPDAWLAGGCLVQTVWNALTRRPLTHGINDYDVIYFDPDMSWEAEDTIIRRLEQRLATLQIKIEIRNQARVHLWYPERHGRPYPPLTSAAESIDRFLTTNTQVGLRKPAQGFELYAPRGLSDAVGLIVRPNATANFSASNYETKVARCSLAGNHGLPGRGDGRRRRYLTTPEISPGLRRGGVTVLLRKQRALRPV